MTSTSNFIPYKLRRFHQTGVGREAVKVGSTNGASQYAGRGPCPVYQTGCCHQPRRQCDGENGLVRVYTLMLVTFFVGTRRWDGSEPIAA